MSYHYSISTSGWYDTDFYDYILPEDAVELTLEEWTTLRERMNTGFVLALNSEGKLQWQDPPPPTAEQILVNQSNILLQLKGEAEAQKTALTSRIGVLNDSIELEMETDEEIAELPVRTAQLKAWKTYAVLLGRVTTQVGWPPEVVWPVKPSEGMDLTTNPAE